MNQYYLAIDIGASSGRHMIAYEENGNLLLKEIYRFPNQVKKKGEHLIWDIVQLKEHVIEGLKRCKELNMIPISIGIDTFGVDYVLLDEKGAIIKDVFSYRDARTIRSKQLYEKENNPVTLFMKTGIQPQSFNTLYQLYDDKMSGRTKEVHQILMLPSYLNYVLTGKAHNEYTISTTTGMINVENQSWDLDILSSLNIKKEQMADIVMPGKILGTLTKEISEEIGFESTVCVIPSHDTASAVTGSFADSDTIFLSSGTWSLIGVLLKNPIVTKESLQAGFTNEGNMHGEVRFLKNIMGLWMIQELRKEIDPNMSFESIILEANKYFDYEQVFDVNDPSLLAPKSMKKAIIALLAKQGNAPTTNGQIFYSVYHSLAKSYAKAVLEIESITQKTFKSINIVGGGSQNTLLNALTKAYTKKELILGPIEATALGNIKTQILAIKGHIK